MSQFLLALISLQLAILLGIGYKVFVSNTGIDRGWDWIVGTQAFLVCMFLASVSVTF